MFIASQNGHKEIVQLLLAVPGININSAMNHGATPLFIASQNGHKEIVLLLLAVAGINVNAATNNGATPLYIAAERGHKEIVQLLVELGGDTSLISYGGKSVWDYAKESRFNERINELILEYRYISDEPLTCEEVCEMILWKKVKCYGK